MSFWGKTQCFVGVHDWSAWSAKRYGSCEQSRYCKRDECDKKETQFVHEWAKKWEYIQSGKCDQKITCAHCGETQNRTYHVWSDWQFKSQASCDKFRTCQRCGEIENHKATERSDHNWGVWDYVSPISCDQVAFCRRCDARWVKKAKEDEHRYSNRTRIDCLHYKEVCSRCKHIRETKIEEADKGWHRFSNWKKNDSYRETRYCLDCLKREYRNIQG